MTLAERTSVVAVMAAMALVVLDAGLINVALPVISTSLHIPPAQAVLAVSSYQAALLVGLLPCAHVAEKLGYSRVFRISLGVFSTASLLCGLATSFEVLVLARVLQGLGGSGILALGIALLRFALGSERLGAAIGWNALNVALCSAVGPVLGAVVLSVASWPWLFFAKLPLIVIALAASLALPKVQRSRSATDTIGIALHAAATGLLFAAAETAKGSLVRTGVLVGTAVGLALFLISRERAHDAPLWPIDLLRQPPFRISIIASACCFIAQSAGSLALPFYLQTGLGHGPATAATVMTCWPVTVAATSFIANRAALKFGSAKLCVAGGAVLGAGLLFSALPPMGNGIAHLALAFGASGFGFGLFQVPNNRTMFLSAPPNRSGAAGGMQGSARLAGQTLGALLMGSLLANESAVVAPRFALAIGALFAIIAAAVSALAVRQPPRPSPSAASPTKQPARGE